jgi:hypothetical protein
MQLFEYEDRGPLTRRKKKTRTEEEDRIDGLGQIQSLGHSSFSTSSLSSSTAACRKKK